MAASHEPDDLRPHYDFATFPKGVRGRFFARHGGRTVGTPTAGRSVGAPTGNSLSGEFIDHMHRLMVPTLSRCTLPICRGSDSPEEVGTGTLIEIGDTVFVVTAAHLTWPRGVSDQLVPPEPTRPAGEQRVPLYAGAPGRVPLVQLTGVGAGDDDSGADLCVIALSPEAASALSSYRPLELRRIDWSNRRPRGGWFVAYGYPSKYLKLDRRQRLMTSEPLLYGSPECRGDLLLFDGAVADEHLLLDVPASGNFNANGHPVMMPWAGGLSGCSLWQCFYPGLRPELWSPDDAQVVAVQTRAYHQPGNFRPPYTIRGTRWHVVADLIREGWPHLAPALSLDVPGPHPAAI